MLLVFSSMSTYCKKNNEHNHKLYRKNLHDEAAKQYKKILKKLEKTEKQRQLHESQQTKQTK